MEDAFLFDLGHEESRHKSITHDRNEVCDIFDAKNRRFIHLKSGKSSPDISHLLRQGVFSAQILRVDKDALEKFRDYLREDGCSIEVVDQLDDIYQFKITFGLLIEPHQTRDVPFFSKVSLQDAVQEALAPMECEFGFIIREQEQ